MEHKIIHKTQNWLEKIVIGHNLCPFAKKEFIQHKIRYAHIEPSSIMKLLELVGLELDFLAENPNTSTSIIVITKILDDFENYLDALEVAQDLLVNMGYEGTFQIASFHPDYLFAGENKHAPSHYTNRSPYPIFHILREDMLEDAIDNYPDTAEIPIRNQAWANKLGIDALKKLLKDL